jgi:hypothetical protein
MIADLCRCQFDERYGRCLAVPLYIATDKQSKSEQSMCLAHHEFFEATSDKRRYTIRRIAKAVTSTTPRTDALRKAVLALKEYTRKNPNHEEFAKLCEELENELNAANKKVRLMKEHDTRSPINRPPRA